ncbi:MAG: hypothetical protein KI790_06350 [Cyclobacteriaceae bacterium]|nr:hypothetical protein [Cyclobacteriaceae bacterium HetDA_MAG_MS6]
MMKNVVLTINLLLLISCSKTDDDSGRLREYVTAKIDAGSISFDTESMSGRLADNPFQLPSLIYIRIDYVGSTYSNVQEYRGIFDHIPTGVELQLLRDEPYSIEVKTIAPSWTGAYGGYAMDGDDVNNDFSAYYIGSIKSNTSVVYIHADSSETSTQFNPELDIYYGHENFSVSNDDENIEISIERKVFGVELDVQGIDPGIIDVDLNTIYHSSMAMEYPADNFLYKEFAIRANGMDQYDPVDSINTRIVYKTDEESLEYVLFQGQIGYERNKIMRIEINNPDINLTDTVATGNLVPDWISFNQEPMTRGDTLIID